MEADTDDGDHHQHHYKGSKSGVILAPSVTSLEPALPIPAKSFEDSFGRFDWNVGESETVEFGSVAVLKDSGDPDVLTWFGIRRISLDTDDVLCGFEDPSGNTFDTCPHDPSQI